LSWLLETMAYVASETYTSTSAPIQYAAVRAFRGGTDIQSYLLHARRILSALGQSLCARLKEAGVRVKAPEGAFYLFADFGLFAGALRKAGITTSALLCEKLLEDTGVAILPGSAFGRAPEELTARIAYVDFDGAQSLLASEALPLEKPLDEHFLATNCGDILCAADRIAEWLESYR
jgi:aspartate aminotransferase